MAMLDDFTRGDSGTLGANWQSHAYAAFDRFALVSNKARYLGQAAGAREQWIGTSPIPFFGPDVEIEATDWSVQADAGSDHWLALHQAVATDTAYAWRVFDAAGGWDLQQLPAFTELASGSRAHTPGDVYRFYVCGRTLRGWVNDSPIFDLTASSPIADTDKLFGIVGWNNNIGTDYTEYDDFKARNVGVTFVAERGTFANTTTGTSQAVDMPAAGSIAVGNYLFLRLACDNSGTSGAAPTTGVSDARNGTWTLAGTANADPGAAAAGVTTRIYYVKVVTAYTNGDDVTVTFSPTTIAKAMKIDELTNVDPSRPIAVAAVTATGTTTPSSAPLAIAPTAAEQTIYVALGIEGPNSQGLSAEDSDTTGGASWRSLGAIGGTNATATNNTKIFGTTKTVNDASAQSYGPNIGTSRDWAMVALVLASAPARLPRAYGTLPYASLLAH